MLKERCKASVGRLEGGGRNNKGRPLEEIAAESYWRW